MLASLENETIFKKAFTDKTVFTRFVKDITGVDIKVDKIETEKQFEPKPGNIAITYDIFAESMDHRVIVEIQRVDYDYNFDRFLHYHIMAIAELQRKAVEYKIDKEVYSIIFLTAPYKIDQKTRAPIKDEVMITSLDPRNLKGKTVELYGHQLVYLNPHYRSDETPECYRDWLDLVYESIHNPENFKVNLNNQGIKKAVEIIDYDKLSPDTITQMKVNQQRKAMLKIVENEGYQKGKKEGIEEGKKQEQIEIAVKMFRSGMSIENISAITGLTPEEIKENS
jgi:predicted transposase/invertase (TIGR01784 family)